MTSTRTPTLDPASRSPWPVSPALTGRLDWAAAGEQLGWRHGQPINIGQLCTDRHVAAGRGQRLALIHEDHAGEVRRYDFADAAELSNGWAAFLREHGLAELDRVCLFLDRVPELYMAFLGVLKLGAVVQPLFSAFGEDALGQRLEDCDTRALITQRKHLSRVRRARKLLPALELVIVIDQGADDRPLREGELAFDMQAGRRPAFAVCPTHAESPSVLHYTSGTTGKPKGALHVHGSILAQLLTTQVVLDLHDDDVYWCTADPGWVTGTSYGIIGPWALGATQLVLDAGFSAPRWYAAMARHGVTVWYTAPTAIRMLMKHGDHEPGRHDLSALRHMASVGEPLNAEAVHWGRRAFGLDFHDTYWQTETGAMVITNRPDLPVKPGSMGQAFPALRAAVLDPDSFEPMHEPGRVGLLAIRPPWPSMLRTYWNNTQTYYDKFRNGWYVCGDQGSVDADGYFWFSGRDDDVINTGGHLVGPFEIESALLEHEAVAESAAIGTPDALNMEVVKAFVALKPGVEPSSVLELSIMNFIRKRLSPLAMPQQIEFVTSLPKTRSGKIMRRLLKARELGEDLGDTSTLEDDD